MKTIIAAQRLLVMEEASSRRRIWLAIHVRQCRRTARDRKSDYADSGKRVEEETERAGGHS